jgi:hypothetical protein
MLETAPEKTNTESFNQPKNWTGTIFEKLRGKDNFLTTGIVITGIITGLVLIILIILLFLSNSVPFFRNFLQNKTLLAPSPVPQLTKISPTPTPIPLEKGPIEFSGSGGLGNLSVRSFKLSDLSPDIGERLNITVNPIDTSGAKITSVEIKINTDTKSRSIPAKLVDPANNGQWLASWVVDDKHDYIYNLVITVTNDKGEKFSPRPRIR